MNLNVLLHKFTRIGLIPVFLIISLIPSVALAESITLAWDATNLSIDGYRIFARRLDQVYNYTNPDWEGAETTCTIDNLEDQTTYCFVARAFSGQLESTDSAEVCYNPSTTQNTPSQVSDNNPPDWDGATPGVGSATDTALGGKITVEFDTADDAVDDNNVKYNVYYADTDAWDGENWDRNNVIADAAIHAGGTLSNAVTVSGLTNNVSHTFGVRAEDQSGNEDTNTNTLTATPTLSQTSGTYQLMLSHVPDRSNAILLDDAGVEENIYVFVDPITEIKEVQFLIDGELQQIENSAPYDLAGGTSDTASPFDASQLSAGYHAFSASITKTDGRLETINASVYVNSGSGTTDPSLPGSSTLDGSQNDESDTTEGESGSSNGDDSDTPTDGGDGGGGGCFIGSLFSP